MADTRPRPGCLPFRFDAGPVGALLQHGFSGCPASMRPMGQWLNQRGISVVGPRLPGHGTKWEDLEQATLEDWEQEAEKALADISSRCSTVIATGLSFGGAMVLHLAAKHPDVVKGVVVINCDLIRPKLALVPIARRFTRTVKGIGNDIKKPGQNELPYDEIPLAALDHLRRFYAMVRKELPSVRAPLRVFTSTEDHVAKAASSRYVLRKAGSTDKEQVMLTNSYHVATLDYDAETIFQGVLDFANTVATGAKPAPA